jgi:DNA invertase Pin-like site-specific DNA recombinase
MQRLWRTRPALYSERRRSPCRLVGACLLKYGYARVSTDDQNPALQIAALKKAKCTHIFQDRLTGATTNRPQFARCLKTLRAGDTLMVWKLGRLGRSLRDLITTLDDWRDRSIRFHSLTENVDTQTPTGQVAPCGR